MKKKELQYFQKRLNGERAKLLSFTEKSNESLQLSPDDLADEVDLASSALNQNLALRLRDRDRSMLQKIDVALSKISAGSFGICDECEEPIEVKRLEARPVAEFCIQCKEAQEYQERHFAE